MIDNRPRSPSLGPVLCLPCQWGVHDACLGAVTICECPDELLIEAEDVYAPNPASGASEHDDGA